MGVKAVLAKSFSRIHKSNLINFGILPLEFSKADDYQNIKLGSQISMDEVAFNLRGESNLLTVTVDGLPVEFKLSLTRRLRDVLA